MNWLKLLNLIPIIAIGIHQLHTDKTLGEKQQFGQDLLAIVTAGATVGLPDADGQLAASIGGIAHTTLADTIAALHNAPPPAPPAA